jgi:hypothetical protein
MTENVAEIESVTRLEMAIATYLERQSQEDSPLGEYDHSGRWYPYLGERRECCRAIRSPSKAFPYSLLKHCMTLRHVAHLYYVDEGKLRRALNQYRKQHREGVK